MAGILTSVATGREERSTSGSWRNSGARAWAVFGFEIPSDNAHGMWEFEVREAGRVVLTAAGKLP